VWSSGSEGGGPASLCDLGVQAGTVTMSVLLGDMVWMTLRRVRPWLANLYEDYVCAVRVKFCHVSGIVVTLYDALGRCCDSYLKISGYEWMSDD